jgi:endonuclease/exonuclease/phosphatase family metal-dependent hydrolase
MKPHDLPTHEEVLAGDLNAAYQREWARIALARALAVQVLAYRLEHGLSQAALAERLKMTQPAVARLESAEHNFTRAMLLRVSKALED